MLRSSDLSSCSCCALQRSELVPVKLSNAVMGPLGQQPSKKVSQFSLVRQSYLLMLIPTQLVVFGVSSIESSFAYHVAKGPSSWTHEDQPALTVARAVLNAYASVTEHARPR